MRVAYEDTIEFVYGFDITSPDHALVEHVNKRYGVDDAHLTYLAGGSSMACTVSSVFEGCCGYFRTKQSGWTPVTIEAAEPGSKEALPFRIIRSKFSNLPVYLDYRNGGTRILTKIRRIDGDVMAMERMLRKIIGDKKLMTRVDELTGSITLHGNYRDSVNEWLRSLGF
ncbi:hypothetical protein EMCRGX_G032353 [Ephydatia muelleri]